MCNRVAMINVSCCNDCPFSDYDNDYDDGICQTTGKVIPNCFGIPVWCPLPFIK